MLKLDNSIIIVSCIWYSRINFCMQSKNPLLTSSSNSTFHSRKRVLDSKSAQQRVRVCEAAPLTFVNICNHVFVLDSIIVKSFLNHFFSSIPRVIYPMIGFFTLSTSIKTLTSALSIWERQLQHSKKKPSRDVLRFSSF